MFLQKNKGKIIINIEKDHERINSNMEFKGIAQKQDLAITTLLINFVSLSIDKGKDPKKIIDEHLENMIELIQKGKQI